MRYAEMFPGMYIVRTRELSWARQLSGVICLVHDGSAPRTIHIQMTNDCVPVGNVLAIGSEADDGYWYDVSSLVSEANSVILPSQQDVEYSHLVEVNYRNFVCDQLRPFVGDEAVGQVCLIGEKQDTGRTVFSKAGYYIVGIDSNDYVAAYQGYCDAASKDYKKLTLRILNLSRSSRAFYPASEIVSACHSAYTEDCGLAKQFRQEIKESIISTSTESTVRSSLSSTIHSLSLEDT